MKITTPQLRKLLKEADASVVESYLSDLREMEKVLPGAIRSLEVLLARKRGKDTGDWFTKALAVDRGGQWLADNPRTGLED
jgi:hypothetical protein